MSLIHQYRSNLSHFVETTCSQIRKERSDRGYIAPVSFLQELHAKIATSGIIPADFPFAAFEIDFIDRTNFQADIVFKSTELISKDKGLYFKEYCPKLVDHLSLFTENGQPFFEEVKMVGMYVNARIPAKNWFSMLGEISDFGGRFGESNIGKGQDIVIDYSSPNAAKHLHAGHIRSTIIGHVLGNLYDACGFSVHRINYLNDWGGVGFLLEGLALWGDITAYENKNELLAEIYQTFRKAQKASEKEDEFIKLSQEEQVNIRKIVGNFVSWTEFKDTFKNFVDRSNKQFSLLEQGDDSVYQEWKKIVDWSLADFSRFYDLLDIHQEYLTGESFYAESGKNLVLREAEKGNILLFNEEHAKSAIELLETELNQESITPEIFARKKEEILADIGCYVVPIENNERFVALKKDGSTIYATRDLAALEHRSHVFAPQKIIYEVGQEQQEHFNKLFRAAKKLELIPNTEPVHIYHGFYVDEATKKKLSSRDGASNILKLLEDTVAYFYKKYDGNDEFSEGEKQKIAKILGVGSIVFNDIKRDKKSSVAISSDFEKMMLQFEESGGAYLIYASCRAKSIIRKYGKTLPHVDQINLKDFTDTEVDMMKKILQFPEVVKKAALTNDPVKVTEYITNIATLFNSYYNSTPILKGDRVEQCLILVASVAQVIDNGLRILHIQSLERI